jgi:hypothetical protein
MLVSEPRTAARGASRPQKTTSHGFRLDFQNTRKTALQKIKIDVMRIGGNGTRQGFKLARRIFAALPELRNI